MNQNKKQKQNIKKKKIERVFFKLCTILLQNIDLYRISKQGLRVCLCVHLNYYNSDVVFSDVR